MKLVTTCPHLPPLPHDEVLAFFSPPVHDGRIFLVMELCPVCTQAVARQMQDAKEIDLLKLVNQAKA